jgi:hypothetical protein
MEVTLATLIIIFVGAVLIGGVIGWYLRDRRRTTYIDIRDRLEPHVRAPQDQVHAVQTRQR